MIHFVKSFDYATELNKFGDKCAQIVKQYKS